jgi:ATP-dependent RNA helicase DHR2
MSRDDETETKASVGLIGSATLKSGKKRKRSGLGDRDGVKLKNGAGTLTKFDEDADKGEPTVFRAAKSNVTKTEGAEDGSKERRLEKPHNRQKAQKSTRPAETSNRVTNSERSIQRQSRDHQHQKIDQGLPRHLQKRRDELLPVRKSLPIWPQAEAIKAALRKNNILVLTGETGSGKSTQVPQFLINEPWCTKRIAITQPRRVAAISLARRVAEEIGSFMGNQSPTARVGYSVRFDNATAASTKIKFLTEGMLLQEMLRDPAMKQYSAVVVDEVHERSVNVDLILGFLKNLVDGQEKRGHPLKVVIMSATADVESLVKFFEGSQPQSSPEVGSLQTPPISPQISTCFVEGRQYPVKTVYLPEPTQDWVESALKAIFQIHYREPLPGDILVFLTGQDTIEGLEKLVNDYAEGMDKDVPKV